MLEPSKSRFFLQRSSVQKVLPACENQLLTSCWKSCLYIHQSYRKPTCVSVYLIFMTDFWNNQLVHGFIKNHCPVVDWYSWHPCFNIGHPVPVSKIRGSNKVSGIEGNVPDLEWFDVICDRQYSKQVLLLMRKHLYPKMIQAYMYFVPFTLKFTRKLT